MINIISYKQYKNIRFFPGIHLAKKGQLVFALLDRQQGRLSYRWQGLYPGRMAGWDPTQTPSGAAIHADGAAPATHISPSARDFRWWWCHVAAGFPRMRLPRVKSESACHHTIYLWGVLTLIHLLIFHLGKTSSTSRKTSPKHSFLVNNTQFRHSFTSI